MSRLLCALLSLLLVAATVRIETADGTLLIETDDETEARIKGGKLLVVGEDGKTRYTLSASAKLQVRVEGADGVTLDTPEFVMKKGGKVVLRVRAGKPSEAKVTERLTRQVLDETRVPTMLGEEPLGAVTFHPEAVTKYERTLEPDAKLRQAVRQARAVLWAISSEAAPADIAEDTAKLRTALKIDPALLRDRFPRVPEKEETTFKNSFENRSREVAILVARLENELETLKEAGSEKESAPPRWQANYDFVMARYLAQLAYLEQYNALLGQMRKELPLLTAKHAGWHVSPNEKATDSSAKKYEKPARKLFGDLAAGHSKTPWEALGKRGQTTPSGMEWRPYEDAPR